MRVAFMGTPDFAVPALQALIDAGHDVACVYTQPPRPKGRGQQVQKSPVHMLAERHDIEVRCPRSLKKDEDAQKEFAALNLDIAVVAAYGLILPKAVLDAPRYGCLNIHASLLPRWRGAAPIQYAVWKGDEISGICIMQMDEGLDTGAVIASHEVNIGEETTSEDLHDVLSPLGAKMVANVLQQITDGTAPAAVPQGEDGTAYAPMLKKDDGRVDWTQSATAIHRQIRALNPWPGVWTETAQGKRLKIIAAEIGEKGTTENPGALLDRAGRVACGEGTILHLLDVQPENSKPMSATAAVNGGHIAPGDKFS